MNAPPAITNATTLPVVRISLEDTLASVQPDSEKPTMALAKTLTSARSTTRRAAEPTPIALTSQEPTLANVKMVSLEMVITACQVPRSHVIRSKVPRATAQRATCLVR
ncbi:hypothetical protein B9Z55_011423 [Caenorhabditis nigoni]|uniref:Uncharacterized protein n=1 Tax=Caenorhabditis nigoni TaxID=1611254 RepID=A0A2G5UJY3_9PELO|nr:hypothetical protein B9Z55_011423 [Caenorhabditis nigoni]